MSKQDKKDKKEKKEKIKEIEKIEDKKTEVVEKKLKLKVSNNESKDYIEEVKQSKLNLVAKFNKLCGGEMLVSGDHKSFLSEDRFSTGSLTLDYALGGGIPAHKTTNIYGEESSSKTTIALKVMADAQKRDRHTLEYIDFKFLEENGFVFNEESNLYCNEAGEIVEPCYCVLVDIEGTFDADWFRCLGGDPSRIHVTMPEYGEQAVDQIDELMSSGIVDVIVVDSLAMMIPIKERDGSAEDGHMGLQARMLNGAFRKWTSRISTLKKENKVVPTVLNINQLRQKIGVMFGSPETLPGGNGQKFAASTIDRKSVV